MRKSLAVIAAMFVLMIPASALAIGFDLSVGSWSQEPGGTLQYTLGAVGTPSDLADGFGFEKQSAVFVRAKFDMPAVIPNINIMHTPMSFEGRMKQSITFGGITFPANPLFPADSKLDLTSTDIALYYGIPLLGTATLDTFGIDLGLNVKVIDFSASVENPLTHIGQSKAMTLPVPMALLGFQFKPTDSLALDIEARGIGYSGNSFVDYMARVKYNPLVLAYIAAGYRAESIKIEEEGVIADIDFSGVFFEAGMEF